MARGSRRGDAGASAEPQAFYEIGVRGRKTGAFLPDRGERDEHGMQPLDSIFSSPHKAPGSAERDNDSGSEDMDIASSAGPGPRTVLKGSRNIQHPIPRSRSPLKTNLQSPARRNPHMDRLSSPIRHSSPPEDEEEEDRDATVTRRLPFEKLTNGSKAMGKAKVNGSKRAPQPLPEMDEEEEDVPHIMTDALQEETLSLIDRLEANDHDSDPSPDEDDEPLVVPKKRAAAGKARGKQPAPEPVAEESPEEEEPQPEPEPASSAKRKRGRPPKATPEQAKPQPPKSKPKQTKAAAAAKKSAPKEPAPAARASQRSRRAAEPEPEPEPEPVEEEEEEPEQQEPESEPEQPEEEPEVNTRRVKKPRIEASAPARKSRGRPSKAAPAASKQQAVPKPKNKPKKLMEKIAEEPDAGEASFMALKSGPPLPKSRGLVSVRHDEIRRTKSGRSSYRPVEFWRGEGLILEDVEQSDAFHRDGFVLPSIKEVVRRPPEERPTTKRSGAGRRVGRPKPKSKQQKIREAADEAADEPEAWELNPGTVMGEVVLWEPEHEMNPPADDEPVQITEDQIALSADAVQTTDIRDATFRFAKTLTMPFMGAGVVDLPPGAEKRPKNSRKMHMVFFVHYGKVLVTVNEAQFRISAGGMWFVPRGNYYSISNDYEAPCRIFFSQACEMKASASMADVSQSMIA
ncbi:kinetochore CENP-C fungal-like protein [Stachybotrys elegans]|uniref:CENP-C homolog n=1 Tax=Stachybotrys elegans TaxID=80388 RepID=A0A8K0SU92_9HYPO|nr:kinetochore CENP-C fungal-like protein [Stachybotrys elegans]